MEEVEKDKLFLVFREDMELALRNQVILPDNWTASAKCSERSKGRNLWCLSCENR